MRVNASVSAYLINSSRILMRFYHFIKFERFGCSSDHLQQINTERSLVTCLL